MADRVLRGSRLGAVSYETDRNHDLAPRQPMRYACPRGHEFEVPFANDAEPPATWECRLHGSISRQAGDAAVQTALPGGGRLGVVGERHLELVTSRARVAHRLPRREVVVAIGLVADSPEPAATEHAVGHASSSLSCGREPLPT